MSTYESNKEKNEDEDNDYKKRKKNDEAPEEEEKPDNEEKISKILHFFSSSVKEPKKEKIRPLTKIVLRRLPPRLTKEGFLKEFELPPCDYLCFVRGDLALGNQSFSRAYVNFANPQDVFGFKDKYDDHPLQDEHGREYHAVVEWAPVQRVPKKSGAKKVAKAGPLETDQKYLEFLKKLETEKNIVGNSSEYFMETENVSAKQPKVTTTPLLEYIKLKRQQKIDLRNETRTKKREAEKERRRKEDEFRKTEKLRKAKEKEKQHSKTDEKDDLNKKEDELQVKKPKEDELKVKKPKEDELKVKKTKEDEKPLSTGHKEKKPESKPSRSEKFDRSEGKSTRREEKFEKRQKNPRKQDTGEASYKSRDKDVDSTSNENKKDIVEERKFPKKPHNGRKSGMDKTVPPYVTDINTGPCSKTEARPEFDLQKTNKEDDKRELARAGPVKSRFRYSEQRNRDREVRNQKMGTKNCDAVVNEAEKTEEEKIDDVTEERNKTSEAPKSSGESISRQSTQETSDGSVDGDDIKSGGGQRKISRGKDPRTERRIRNKDRPSIEIYRPGMGKFSKQRLEQKKDDGSESEEKGDVGHSMKDRYERKRDDDSSKSSRKIERSKERKTGPSDGVEPMKVEGPKDGREIEKANDASLAEKIDDSEGGGQENSDSSWAKNEIFKESHKDLAKHPPEGIVEKLELEGTHGTEKCENEAELQNSKQNIDDEIPNKRENSKESSSSDKEDCGDIKPLAPLGVGE